MQRFSEEHLGSRLDITCHTQDSIQELVEMSFVHIQKFEQAYSRFIPGNTLSTINSEKGGKLPADILALIRLSKKVSNLTQGHYDITVLPILENNGYGIESEKLVESIGYTHIHCTDTSLGLENNVSIEFGSFGKGYMLDIVRGILVSGTDNAVINFGGDIHTIGRHTVQLEDPLDSKKSIGTIELTDQSIASSAGNKRKLSVGHHLVQSTDREKKDDKICIYVTHKNGVYADMFATALFVTPLDLSIRIIEQIPGLEALIIGVDGKIFKSPGFICNIHT